MAGGELFKSPRFIGQGNGATIKKPRMTIYWIIGLSTLVLCLNIGFLIWAAQNWDAEADSHVIFTGSCTKVKRLELWLHLVINILSTVLVSSSNFCIQSLNSPTRAEVDAAHEKGQSCRVGVNDLSNTLRISWWKRGVIFALSFSSLTLHLIYNATIFDSLATTSYSVSGVQSSFLDGAPYNLQDLNISSSFDNDELRTLQRNISQLERLENRECLDYYSNPLPTDRGDLLLVLDTPPSTVDNSSSVLTFETPCFDCADSISWLCNGNTPKNDKCTPELVKRYSSNAGNWSATGGVLGDSQVRIQYCLSERQPERCSLKCSQTMFIVVIVWNAVKIGCFIIAAMDCRLTLVKVGDAIYSFLKTPDETAAGEGQLPPRRAIMPRSRFLLRRSPGSIKPDWRTLYSGGRVRRWWSAAGSGRWAFFAFVSITILTLGAAYLGITIDHLAGKGYPTDFGHLWTLGFGAVSGFTLIDDGAHTGIVGNSVIANLPQLMVSTLYFVVNGIATCQLAEREWNRFGYDPRYLRTTFPSPGESSVFYLSLPYIYSGPLLLLFIWLHLSVSQSLFAAEVAFYTYDGRVGPVTYKFDETMARTQGLTLSTLCASPIAAIVAFWLMAVVLILVAANSVRKYDSLMPFLGTDTAILAACCHSTEDADDLLRSKVAWKPSSSDDESGPFGGSFYAVEDKAKPEPRRESDEGPEEDS